MRGDHLEGEQSSPFLPGDRPEEAGEERRDTGGDERGAIAGSPGEVDVEAEAHGATLRPGAPENAIKQTRVRSVY